MLCWRDPQLALASVLHAANITPVKWKHHISTQTPVHTLCGAPSSLALTSQQRSIRFCFFRILLFTSWSEAENSKAGICVLTGLSVLTELSYDMLVVNLSRETYTHQGQTCLTTLCLLPPTFPWNLCITYTPLSAHSAVIHFFLTLRWWCHFWACRTFSFVFFSQVVDDESQVPLPLGCQLEGQLMLIFKSKGIRTLYWRCVKVIL